MRLPGLGCVRFDPLASLDLGTSTLSILNFNEPNEPTMTSSCTSVPSMRGLRKTPILSRPCRLILYLVAFFMFSGMGLLSLATPASAACAPGVSDGKDSPDPIFPQAGLAGSLTRHPARVGADPFSSTQPGSIYQAYGVNWVRWNTYDLGCGGELRNPRAASDTGLANVIVGVGRVTTALTANIASYAYQPGSWIQKLDPVLTTVAAGIHRGFASPFGPIAVIFTGWSVIWGARKLRFAAVTSTVLVLLAGITIAFAASNSAVTWGRSADTLVSESANQLNNRINGFSATKTDPGVAAISPYVDQILYDHWLAGQLGSAQSLAAKKYGPDLFRAQAVSWQEADRVQGNPTATRTLIAEKKALWGRTAAEIQKIDPDAYAYLTGQRMNRSAEAMWMSIGSLTLLMPMLSFLLLLMSYLILRFMVMTAPAWATVAIIPAFRGTLRSAFGLAAAAIINPLILVTASSMSIMMTGYLVDPDTGLGWLGLILALLLTIGLWIFLKPIRRIGSLITGKPIHHKDFNQDAWRGRITGLLAGGFGALIASRRAEIPASPASDSSAPDAEPAPVIRRYFYRTEQNTELPELEYRPRPSSAVLIPTRVITRVVPSEAVASPSTFAQTRPQELREQLPLHIRDKVRMSVGIGVDESGATRVIIGTNEPRGYLRPGVSLNIGEEIAQLSGPTPPTVVHFI